MINAPRASALAAALLVTLSLAHADHGGGAGASAPTFVPGADLLEHGRTRVTATYGFTDLEEISEAALRARGIASPDAHFEAANEIHRTGIEFTHGVTHQLEVAIAASWRGVRTYHEAHAENPAAVSLQVADPSGFEDVWVRSKWALEEMPWGGRTALLGGIKIPTGDSRNRRGSGGILELGWQPSSDSLDALLGLAHTRDLSGRLRLDLGASYIARGQGSNNERIGNRGNVSGGLAYRLTRDPEARWIWTAGLGAHWQHDAANRRLNLNRLNSGGDLVLVQPRISLAHNDWVFSIDAGLPVSDEPNGNSQETDFTLGAGVAWTFGGHSH